MRGRTTKDRKLATRANQFNSREIISLANISTKIQSGPTTRLLVHDECNTVSNAFENPAPIKVSPVVNLPNVTATI
uniref:AlNc14C120G6654 protein n=1 Tax=Albugo laibachii Nc14 TaxID=890382 RepID=F0WJC7_9STRA|nr:AlNc14C120G6654 [Albugo laibachii Nc14]|eukprot:CCA21374.1 AlNc14C120G6654 [Albugo laibachii Nc14]